MATSISRGATTTNSPGTADLDLPDIIAVGIRP